MYSRNSVIQRSTHGLGSFGVDSRLALRALEVVAFRLRLFLNEDWIRARGAGLLHGAVPDAELALRVAAAAEERLTPARAPLDQLPGAAVGARDAQTERARSLAFRITRTREEFSEAPRAHPHGALAERTGLGRDFGGLGLLFHRHGRLAFGISRAREKGPVPTVPLYHLRAALRAYAIGLLGERGLEALALRFRLGEILLEGRVELRDHVVPGVLPVLDPVQLPLHLGRELHLEHVAEHLREKLPHRHAQLGRGQLAPVAQHVIAREDGADDRRVGARAADALLLERLHEGGLGIAGRRLREVLLGKDAELL